MRREWAESRTRGAKERPADLASSSWNARRSTLVGILIAVACFAGGLAASSLPILEQIE